MKTINLKPMLAGLVMLVLTGTVTGQEVSRSRAGFLTAGMLQVRESANFGLVFTGPALNYGMKFQREHPRFTSIYEFDLGLATPLTRQIIGINFHVKPVDLVLGYKFPLGRVSLLAGPAFRLEYNAQFYPDLQSGYDFWLTELSLGLAVQATIPAGRSLFTLRLRNTATGLICRNETYTDPYFFDLGFLETVRDLHRNGKGFGPGSFNNTNIEIHCRPNPTSRLSFSFCADYARYSDAPSLGMLNQTIRLYFHPKY
jgi:hypothetical protein